MKAALEPAAQARPRIAASTSRAREPGTVDGIAKRPKKPRGSVRPLPPRPPLIYLLRRFGEFASAIGAITSRRRGKCRLVGTRGVTCAEASLTLGHGPVWRVRTPMSQADGELREPEVTDICSGRTMQVALNSVGKW